jgi:hypothetical protein
MTKSKDDLQNKLDQAYEALKEFEKFKPSHYVIEKYFVQLAQWGRGERAERPRRSDFGLTIL